MRFVRACLVFALLLVVKALSRIFYRHEIGWASEARPDWGKVRLLVGLNHTSLYEPLYAGSMPTRLLWRLARYGVLPVADKTAKRPLIGLFFKCLAQDVIDITRKQDETWEKVLRLIRQDSLIIIFPEGRMKRENGLDANGNPMTVRGGIADLISTVPAGEMVLVFLGGLHHVQVPGQFLPKPFRTLRLKFEALGIAAYREERLAEAGPEGLKIAVITDLQGRRDRHCPSSPTSDDIPDSAPAESLSA